MLYGPTALLQYALLPGNSIWAGLLVGGILFIMGLIQLLVPSNSLITGSIAVILSLVSLPVAAGGLGIGMLLGITGGAMGIAWQPVSQSKIAHFISPQTSSQDGLRNLFLAHTE